MGPRPAKDPMVRDHAYDCKTVADISTYKAIKFPLLTYLRHVVPSEYPAMFSPSLKGFRAAQTDDFLSTS